MNYQISANCKNITGSINLPASKSISNRALIINACSFNPYPILNLSNSDDTKVLVNALNSNSNKFDIGHAGTAMRFLTAFLSKIAGEWEVTGSERMQERPISILIDALIKLGAKIEYIKNEGFPPIKIYGSHLKGKTIELDGSISSQYISALLLIAPTIENGLKLKLNGNITSRPYIDLTLELMGEFGIKYNWEGNEITVPEQNYFPRDFIVEADWSGASYWYQILATADRGGIFLENLQLKSLQGDANIAGWFEQFGVLSTQKENGVFLKKNENITPKCLKLHFIENPDVAQTMACLCVSKQIPFHFSGLKTLKIKETNRIAALQNELIKFGAELTEPENGKLEWNGKINPTLKKDKPIIKTYHDHRMALAFAPMALDGNILQIENPLVVTKSYPGFWEDLKKTGFEIASLS
ncbi:MAG: 3-phosphoshikimate 1-carboxyvinyltransferase [Prolixibacteraceae bacterium]|jgi:3-phosphoshikimate 1-carboxyvinyltransferase|nr:3-phosphoshikimate 1-carboxyvinyltransferase [Prolixibacteraceae bacterium]MBT6006595.1 3-phosphoshikimate 1-carboxyvinyltransferase [Prolixibacteraceae bacterium]MBT6764449.1 3-phosphoshikimate 1-carboxyvinyltransferase [Prolixibacteraceae bacterium]MBT6998173.1 3-phosphoshikimate 1-carboxyvinyltransferase [Prolixibacteraceae bacterium]MBT7397019.1 3-phosphoshikimate 1-carboxyvinyltransferase [Prolixibacteraceae bacterium]